MTTLTMKLTKVELGVVKTGLQTLREFYESQVNYARSDERDDWMKKLCSVEELEQKISSILEKE